MNDDIREAIRKISVDLKNNRKGMTQKQEMRWILRTIKDIKKHFDGNNYEKHMEMKPYFDRLDEIREFDRETQVHGQHFYARRWQKAG